MHYTLHQLRLFLKIVEERSITKAAEALHLTQPAVSIQLRKFQDQFEIPLTEVIGRQLYITDFGKEIAEACARIMDEVHAIKFKTQAYRGQLSGQIKISVVSTGKYVMPYFLNDFLERHEGIDLIMDVTNRTQTLRSLEKNEVDFALVSVLPEKLQIDKITLMENRLHLVGNQSKAFPKKKYKSDILESMPLIFREPGSATRQAMEGFISNINLTVKKKITLTSNEAVKQAVLAGLGYSIMPLIGLKNELLNSNIQVIPVQGLPIITNWNLVWQKQKKFSPAAAAYLEFLNTEKATIIGKAFAWYENL